MATLARGTIITKRLTPEQTSEALAAWCLVQRGINLDANCRVKTDFKFTSGNKTFVEARVEIEVL